MIHHTFQIESYSVAYLGLRDAADTEIFNYARHENAIVMTKDEDFVQLYYKLGVPPQIIWITTGNTSNEYMRKLLLDKLPQVVHLLKMHELVEIAD